MFFENLISREENISDRNTVIRFLSVYHAIGCRAGQLWTFSSTSTSSTSTAKMVFENENFEYNDFEICVQRHCSIIIEYI